MVFHHPFEEYSRRIGSFPRKNKKLLKPPSLSEIRWISNQVPQRILELPVLSEPEIPENFQQAPWKRSFFRKKNEENLLSRDPNPKIEDLMRWGIETAFEERVVSCSSNLPAESQRSCTSHTNQHHHKLPSCKTSLEQACRFGNAVPPLKVFKKVYRVFYESFDILI